MKHLLNGVAIAAALAIAAPVWAQAPMTPSSPPKAPMAGAPMAPMAGAPMAPMAGKQKKKRMAGKSAKGGKGVKMAKGDAMTDQLNREELARIQGGGGPPPPPAAAPKALQGPRVGPMN